MGREHVIITQGKMEAKRIQKIETKLKDIQSEDAQCMKEEIMNDPKMKQTNNDTNGLTILIDPDNKCKVHKKRAPT